MRAVTYTEHGDPSVLQLVERPEPHPGPGEVRVRIAVAGVNPSDWKIRRTAGPLPFPEVVPGQDGAGTIDELGDGVSSDRLGQRVWLREAGRRPGGGTAQELVVLPVRHALPLPDDASFDLGASLGIPAITAHRCLTVGVTTAGGIAPGSLHGLNVLAAGGAGAVGHAAIQLARWAGATVITTVSSPMKASLAQAAGAHHVVDYRRDSAEDAIRAAAPDGVDIVAEVAPTDNAPLDLAVLALNGVVAVYAGTVGMELALPVRALIERNARYQFVFLYAMPEAAKEQAVADVQAAVTAGVLGVGESHGLPLIRFPLEEAAAAHQAVEDGAVGKVLLDIVR